MTSRTRAEVDEQSRIIEESRQRANDDTDVPAALKRATQDGKGESEPPPSDWTGYATEGAIRED